MSFKPNLTAMSTYTTYKQNWSKINKDKMNLYTRKRYHKRAVLLNSFKNRPCSDCRGWFETCQMDFDHKDNKVFSIGSAKRSVSLNRLLNEVKKCDVVCANCHRLRTKRRGFWNQIHKNL